MISGYPKHKFFSRNFFPKVFTRPPKSEKDLGGLEGTLGQKFREFFLCFGYPEIIGDQMRYLRNKFEIKVGE